MGAQSLVKAASQIRVAILASTGGGVYREACRRSKFLRSRVSLVVVDRPCGASNVAGEYGHSVRLIPWEGKESFSSKLLSVLVDSRIDVLISFYTRLLAGRLLDQFEGRIVNFHPSILPACPGMRGFEDSLRSGARILGSTVHFIDCGIDSGKPLLQAHFYRDPKMSFEELRDRVFVQQCKSLVQVVRWFEEGRISIEDEMVLVNGSMLGDGEFSPGLDDAEAQSLFENLAAPQRST